MITSMSNSQVKALHSLMKKSKERYKQKLFVVEGIKMFEEIPKRWLKQVYVSESFLKDKERAKLIENFSYETLSDTVFKSVSDTQTPQGIVAVVQMPSYRLDELMRDKDTLLLILDSVQDPGNLGTIMRTAEGAGVTGIIMNHTTVDLFNPKTVRSTMGSVFRVPFFITEDLQIVLQQLQKDGVCLYAAHLRGEKFYDAFDYTKASGFLIGNEGNGLNEAIASCADEYIRIPMEGAVESLNAAVAASILVYEGNRQRRKG